MKCAWLTDIHLNFLEREERLTFYQCVKACNVDIILLSGDIAEAPTVVNLLEEMYEAIQSPIYFVVGNHDYYFGQIEQVKNQLETLTKNGNKLFWMPAAGPILLDDGVMLVGQDGWADGRLGDYSNSPVVLADSRLITELFQQKLLGKYQLLNKMQQLADLDAALLQTDLDNSLKHNPKKIIVLTHVPPFKEVCLYNGEPSDNNWLPFFSSFASGEVLYKFSLENTQIELLVLCGHTHSYADVKILSNLRVKVGRAEYYKPEVQEVFEY